MRQRFRRRGAHTCLTRLLRSISFDADSVQFVDGARFPRDALLTTSVDQPYRLDVLCFLAQFASRYPGVVNAAAYLKARALSRCVVSSRISQRRQVLTRALLPVRMCAGGSQRWRGDRRNH